MSKRFGRNQKRRLAQVLAQLQAVNDTHVDVSGRQISEISRLQSRLRAVEIVLGVDNPAFPANRMEALGPTKYDPLGRVRMRNGNYAHPMTMSTQERPFYHREQAHIILTYKHHRWGYAITEQALRLYPREVLARGIAEEFTHMVLDELNKLGVRR